MKDDLPKAPGPGGLDILIDLDDAIESLFAMSFVRTANPTTRKP